MKFIFEDTQDRTQEEQEELYELLTEKALSKDHTSFEYIKNTTEFSVMRQAVSGLESVIKLYECICEELYKAYCDQVLTGSTDFNMLYILRQNQECKTFYKKELEIAQDMIDEYWAYVWSGHFLDQWLLFRNRESWHLWDHRKDNSFGE